MDKPMNLLRGALLAGALVLGLIYFWLTLRFAVARTLASDMAMASPLASTGASPRLW